MTKVSEDEFLIRIANARLAKIKQLESENERLKAQVRRQDKELRVMNKNAQPSITWTKSMTWRDISD